MLILVEGYVVFIGLSRILHKWDRTPWCDNFNTVSCLLIPPEDCLTQLGILLLSSFPPRHAERSRVKTEK